MIFFYCLKIATMKKKYPLTAESLAKLKCDVDSSLRFLEVQSSAKIGEFFFSISYVNASTKKRERRLISRENADVIVN